MKQFRSWGNYPDIEQRGVFLRRRSDPLSDVKPILPFGNGRSYGDSCLVENGTVVATRRLDNFISFDRAAGRIRCEAGVLLSELLQVTVPAGWFLPVTPGTSFVTVGGAIANDVHGKNHHRFGTFGVHVTCFELLRSDGSRRVCSLDSDTELFRATIGGLGLTGLVTWAEIQLFPVGGNGMDVENIKFGSLEEFFDLTAESDGDYDYTVSWIDCVGGAKRLGRGIFSRSNHSETIVNEPRARPVFPFTPPISLVNRHTVSVFNELYYRRQISARSCSTTHYRPFLYPLDSLKHWNRVYGKNGFLQYQFVVPVAEGRRAVDDILTVVAKSGMASTLAVLKVFGDEPSPGLLSFPMPGVSLAMDFPWRGGATLRLFRKLDDIVLGAGGRLYPEKDAHMAAEYFQTYYPGWETLEQLRDPAITSSFWQRVTET